jgi:DNA segregation ATPase FtsK/SpoIIIE-like protein
MPTEPILVAKAPADLFLLPALANRHGLVAGATGTGKTVTLRVLAEGFSRIGVPVVLADVKGEVSVAVMGCEVNGPGEAAAADVGVAYGHGGVGLLFKNGKIVKRMRAEELEEALVAEAERISAEREQK